MPCDLTDEILLSMYVGELWRLSRFIRILIDGVFR
jgi:hypothetical protein